MEKKKYSSDESILSSTAHEPSIIYLIDAVKTGITYSSFLVLAAQIPFSISEWCHFLNLSERTFQRYKKEKKSFESLHAERIMKIALVYTQGVSIFGTNEQFNAWLELQNPALGGVSPKSLLDTGFGIDLIKEELQKIAHGIFA